MSRTNECLYIIHLCAVQMHHLGPDLREGDVLLSNHPAAGGSHLPDLTVITPVSSVYVICLYIIYYHFLTNQNHMIR